MLFYNSLCTRACDSNSQNVQSAAGTINRNSGRSQEGTYSKVLTAGLSPERIAAIWVIFLLCL